MILGELRPWVEALVVGQGVEALVDDDAVAGLVPGLLIVLYLLGQDVLGVEVDVGLGPVGAVEAAGDVAVGACVDDQ